MHDGCFEACDREELRADSDDLRWGTVDPLQKHDSHRFLVFFHKRAPCCVERSRRSQCCVECVHDVIAPIDGLAKRTKVRVETASVAVGEEPENRQRQGTAGHQRPGRRRRPERCRKLASPVIGTIGAESSPHAKRASSNKPRVWRMLKDNGSMRFDPFRSILSSFSVLVGTSAAVLWWLSVIDPSMERGDRVVSPSSK